MRLILLNNQLVVTHTVWFKVYNTNVKRLHNKHDLDFKCLLVAAN